MSQTTSALFYSTNARLICAAVLKECLALAECRDNIGALLASSVKSEWQAFKKEREFDQKSEWIGDSLTVADVAKLVDDKTVLSLDLKSSPLIFPIHRAVLNGLHPSIYGNHCPGNLSMQIGWHDLFDEVENENGHLYARASISISFWGNSIPSNLHKYRTQFFELQDVLAVQKKFEQILGKLDGCLLLNV